MAGYANGGSEFSDDELDQLPLNAFRELEHNAIQFTQAATQGRPKPAPSSDYGDDFDDENLDDAVVIDESRSAPAYDSRYRANLDTQTQLEEFRQQRYGRPGLVPSLSRPDVPVSKFETASDSSVVQLRNVPQHSARASQSVDEVEALRKEIESLRGEKQALQHVINAKAGEVAIVRSKAEKDSKERQRELHAVQKASEEKFAKQQRELEVARAAAQNAATERDFIKQDLADSVRVQRLNKTVEKKDLTTTPKKKKSLPHRDGFNDDELEVLSPSKVSPTKFQRRTGTPTKAGKRKRKPLDSSPTGPLVVVEDQAPVEDRALLDESILARLGLQDDRLDFLGTILDHRPSKDHLRTIEELGKHSFPSAPQESFESIILGKIPALGLNKSATELPVGLCELVISLWKQCFEEKYYDPIFLFVDILTLALEIKTVSIAPQIISSLVPIAQETADIVAVPRWRRQALEGFEEHISVSACLSLLHLAALGCMSDLQYITRFWQLMRIDFVLSILSQNQPTNDFLAMLKMLSTSVFPETFGAITTDSAKQYQNAGYIIDRLLYPIYQIPFQPFANVRLDPEVLLTLRIGILDLLMSMTRSSFASTALALHIRALACLVCLMADELDTLYEWRAGHKASAEILNRATRLLYHLVTKHAGLIDMQEKLSRFHGASHKYLLVLARLNFSQEDLVLESGIEQDIPGLALEMLESAVTPQEGDDIFAAFLGSA